MSVTLPIPVADIVSTIATYTEIRVYRSVTVVAGPYSEVSIAGTRPTLVAGQSLYEFEDATGAAAYFYRWTFHDGVAAESAPSDPIEATFIGLLLDYDDLISEGLTVTTAAQKARALELIRTWQAFVENETGLFFEMRQLTLDVDGRGTNLLQLWIPIVSITSLYVNDDFLIALDAADFLAYDGRGGHFGRDDRRNPRIKLVTQEQSIFSGTGPVPMTGGIFEVGEKNQRVVGTFGFVEADGAAPAPIKYALKKLVIRAWPQLGLSGGSTPAGPMIEEETDRHRKKWADPSSGSKAWSITGDPEVDRILARYRRPMIVRGPRTMFGRNRRSTWGL